MITRVCRVVWRGGWALVSGWAVLSLLHTPGWLAAFAIALGMATAMAPLSGLLILAGLVPVGGALGALSGTAAATEVLVVAFLAGAAARGAVKSGGNPTVIPIPVPVALLALAIVSSAAVQMALRRVRSGPDLFASDMARLLAGHYFLMPTDLGPLAAAALLLEGLALFVVVRTLVRRNPERLTALMRMMVAGAAGAALLNVSRLVTSAVLTGSPWDALPRLAQTWRINVQYTDINAAGSYFAMLLCLAVGSTIAATRRSRLPWALATVAIALALWLTSSRSAILALLIMGAVTVGLSRLGRERTQATRPTLLGAAAIALAALLVVAFLPNRLVGINTTAAFQIRRDLSVVSMRMLGTDPIFGVGIGQFYERSAPEIARLPVRTYYVRENAHNNLLQILAELGVFGFVCFGLVLWLAASGFTSRRTGQPLDRAPGRPAQMPAAAIAAGLATFLLSALFGHPLLTPACAYAFWMTAGAAAALAPPLRRIALARAAALAACALMLVSTPLRARAAIRDADLEHFGYGLSLWETAEDGSRYRIARGPATIFVPGDAVVAQVLLRTDARAATPLPVSVRLHGRLVDRLRIPGDSWTRYTFTVPERERSRFIPLQLALEGDPAARLHVGKVTVVEQRKGR